MVPDDDDDEAVLLGIQCNKLIKGKDGKETIVLFY